MQNLATRLTVAVLTVFLSLGWGTLSAQTPPDTTASGESSSTEETSSVTAKLLTPEQLCQMGCAPAGVSWCNPLPVVAGYTYKVPPPLGDTTMTTPATSPGLSPSPSSFTGGVEVSSFTLLGNDSEYWIFPIFASIFGGYTHPSGFGFRSGLSAGIWVTEDAAPGLFGLHAEGTKMWSKWGIFLGGMVFYAMNPNLDHTGYLWGLARGGGEIFLLEKTLSVKGWASVTTFDQLVRQGGLGLGLSFAWTF